MEDPTLRVYIYICIDILVILVYITMLLQFHRRQLCLQKVADKSFELAQTPFIAWVDALCQWVPIRLQRSIPSKQTESIESLHQGEAPLSQAGWIHALLGTCRSCLRHFSNLKFLCQQKQATAGSLQNVWGEGNYVSSPGCSGPHSISTPSKPLTAPVVFWVPVNFINQLVVLINVMQQLLRYGTGLLAIRGLCVAAKGTHQEWKVPQPAKEGGRVFSGCNLGMISQW